MKKTIIVCLIMLFAIAPAIANENTMQNNTHYTNEQAQKYRAQKESEFEKKLSLTDKQKIQAKNLRINGHEKMHPIMQQIKMKEMEKQIIRYSQSNQKIQKEQIAKIDADINKLQKQASEIRKQNMNDFEAILTQEQKNTLKTMKREGRERYRANHPIKLNNLQNHSI